MRRVALVLAATALTLVLASGIALAINEVGTNGPNTLRGTDKDDILSGRGGNDVLFGLRGSDNLLGGSGKDVLFGGNERRPLGGDKNLAGGRGNDAVFGGQGSDNLLGGQGNDLVVDGSLTESSEDNLSGGGGNDVLEAINDPAFEDKIVCGRGFDFVFANRKDVVAPDCEKVAVGLAAVERLAQSIPLSFFEGLHPRLFEILG